MCAAPPLQVTRDWFAMSESAPAGGVISLGMVIGACLGLAVTPLIVRGPDDIPIMNLVWGAIQ